MSQTGNKRGLFIEPFKIPTNRFLLVLLGESGFNISLLIALVALGFIVLGILFGYRYLVLALLWIFIVLPLIFFYLYVFHALKPLSVYNSLPHSLKFKQDSVEITIYSSSGGDKGKKNKRKSKETKEVKEADESEEKTILIEDYKIEKIKRGSYGVALFFNSPQQGILLIPYTSFKDSSELATLTTITTSHLSN